MKKFMKKSIAWILSLVMALSTLTCLAMAADDENAEETPSVTVRITCDLDELRPGDTVHVTYWLQAPIENPYRITIKTAVPDGLSYSSYSGVCTQEQLFYFWGLDADAPDDAGGGEVTPPTVSNGSLTFQAHAYDAASTRVFEEDLKLFTITYNVRTDAEEANVTFELEEASITLAGAGNAEVNVDADPIQIVVVDTKALESKVASAKTLLSLTSFYTEESLANLEEAVAFAENILDNIRSYYQDDVDAALEILNTAYDGVKKISDVEALEVSRTELEEAVEAAEQLDEAAYTEDSWKVLQEAIDNAKEVLDNEDATQEELDDAAQALADAVEGLVEINGGYSGTGTTGTTGGSTGTTGGTTGTTGGTSGTGSTITSPQTGENSILTASIIALAAGMCVCAGLFTIKAKKVKR